MSAEGPRAGSSEGSGPGSLSPAKAFVVLVLFVAGVAVLVSVGTRPTTVPTSAGSVTTTTVPPHSTTTSSTTTTTTVPRSSVSVVVANATSVNGVAAHYSSVLSGQGWSTQTPVNATTTASTSTVYYAPGDQSEAAEVAATLGIAAASVQPVGASTPVATTSGVDVIVIIGQDLANAAGA